MRQFKQEQANRKQFKKSRSSNLSKGQFKQRASKDQFNGDDMHPDGLRYSEKLLAKKD